MFCINNHFLLRFKSQNIIRLTWNRLFPTHIRVQLWRSQIINKRAIHARFWPGIRRNLFIIFPIKSLRSISTIFFLFYGIFVSKDNLRGLFTILFWQLVIDSAYQSAQFQTRSPTFHRRHNPWKHFIPTLDLFFFPDRRSQHGKCFFCRVILLQLCGWFSGVKSVIQWLRRQIFLRNYWHGLVNMLC